MKATGSDDCSCGFAFPLLRLPKTSCILKSINPTEKNVLVYIRFNVLGDHPRWRVAHIRHGANRLAHNLAQWAIAANFVGSIPVSCIPNDILDSDNPPIPS